MHPTYRLRNSASQPARLELLKRQFGEDVYTGLIGQGAIHLVSSREQVKRLERFYKEHYETTIKSVPVARFEVGDVEITAWLLNDEED